MQVCRYAECTTTVRLPNKCISLEDDCTIYTHKPSLSTSPTTRSFLRTNKTTTPEALMRSHVRVGSISRSNNKQQICTNIVVLKPPAIASLALLSLLLRSCSKRLRRYLAPHHQLAVSKSASHFETYIACTPASAKAMQQRCCIFLRCPSYPLIVS